MNANIVISGFSRNDLTFGAAEMLFKGGNIILHTEQCYLSQWLKEHSLSYTSLDDIYMQASDFEELTRMALDKLEETEECTFCVMDASDETARALIGKYPRTRVFGGSAWAALELRAEGRYTNLSASDLSAAPLSSRCGAFIREIDTRLMAGDVKLLLEDVYGEDAEAFFRMPEGDIVPLPLSRLDRLQRYDHRCACLVNPPQMPIVRDFEGLKLISATKEVKDACLDEETLAQRLVSVVQSTLAAEARGMFTQTDVMLRAAEIITEGE